MMKEYSILDAFRALEELEKEELKEKPVSKSINEGKSFDLSNNEKMAEAETFIKESENKDETELQVIDVDADALDHVKNNEEYIGQYILQCNACKSLRYIVEDKLQASENDPAIYNVEDECPHCHATNSGYTLIGQVGKVEKAEEEPTIENDEASEEELTFEKEPEEEPVEEAPAEAEEEEVIEEEPETEEVEADDTADMESTFGDEINSDETAEDDTEEPEEKEEMDLASQLDALNDDEEEESEEEPKKKREKRESLKSRILAEGLENESVADFLSVLIEPEHIKEIIIADGDNQDFILFKGTYNDIPENLLKATFVNFHTGDGSITIHASEEGEGTHWYEYVDEFVSEMSSGRVNIEVGNDVVASFAKGSEFENDALTEVDEFRFEGAEVVSTLSITAKDIEGEKTYIKEDFEPSTPEEELAKKIILGNPALRIENIKKQGTPENWILGDLVEGPFEQDLYIHYVAGLDSSIKDEFKKIASLEFDPEYVDIQFQRTLKAEQEALTEDFEGDEDEEEFPWEEPIDIQKTLLETAKKIAANPEGERELDDWTTDDAATVLVACSFLNKPFSEAKELFYGPDYDYLKITFNDGSEHYFYSRGVYFQGIKDAGENGDDFGPVLTFPEDFDIKVIDSAFETENIHEAKEEDELPADPDAVKTNVHSTLNDLVKDEIEAIEGYEEAKAEIADTHIEHKDDIIAALDHIQDEEEEHIDELIDAASEIPFDKEQTEEPAIEEPVETEEVPAEAETEIIEEPVEESVNEDINITVNDEEIKINDGVEDIAVIPTPAVSSEETKEEMPTEVQAEEEEPKEEVEIEVEEPTVEEENNEQELTEAAAEVPSIEEIKSELDDLFIDESVETEASTEPVVEELDIDENSINEAINQQLKDTGNEDTIFEARSGSYDDKSFLVEGVIKTEGLEVPASFRFENIENNQYRVTNSLSDEVYTLNLNK